MAKLLYFLAGAPGVPATSAETAEIAVCNALAASQYEVQVMCGGSRASITGINLSAVATDNSYNDAGSTITAGTISAAAADNSLNDSGNGFVTAGFKVGDVLTISGFTGATANNTAATAVAESVAAGKIVVSMVTLVNDDAGESVTVSTGGRFLQRGFAKDMNVMVRGFTTAANNISTGIITALTASKMTIGGTDGDGIADEIAGDTVTICSVETGILQGSAVIAADYIAGTVPEQYKSAGTPLYPVFDPANPPDVPALVETQGVVSDAETLALDTAGTVTFGVAAHVISGDVAATEYVVTHHDTLALDTSGTVTFDVAAHAMTGDVAATEYVVANAGTLNLTTAGQVTFGVSAHALTGDVASGTAVVANNAATTITGTGTAQAVKIGVTGRSVSGVTFTDATDTSITNGVTTTLDGATIGLAVGSRALGVATFSAATDCVVSNNDTTTLATKTIKLAVGTNTLGVATFDAATDAVVSDAATVAVVNSAETASDNATATVAVNALTNVKLPSNKTVVQDADTVSVDGVSVPLVVSAGALAATTLIASGSTSKVITSGIEIPATGVITTKVTVTIVDGVITACVGG